jgi:protein Mpv17
LGFLFYGGLYQYQGMAQNWMYTQCYPELFGSSSSWDTVAAQVGFEMLVMGPFVCLPIAYIVKATFTSSTSGHDDHDHLMPLSWETVQKSLKKYVDDCKVRNLLFKFWALWIPVNSLAFSVIPSHFRVAFVACVSFFWVMILSSTSADCRGNIQPQQRVK